MNGLNQPRSNESPAGAYRVPTCTSATTANATSSTIWKPTSTNCTRSLVVMPRLAIQVASAMNTSVVPTFTNLLPGRSAMLGASNSFAMNR